MSEKPAKKESVPLPPPIPLPQQVPSQPPTPQPQQPAPPPININVSTTPYSTLQQPTPKIYTKPDKVPSIPKRTAALEVYRHLIGHRLLCIITIAGAFITVLATLTSMTIGAIAAVGLAGIAGFFLVKVNREMQRLQATYSINPKAIQ